MEVVGGAGAHHHHHHHPHHRSWYESPAGSSTSPSCRNEPLGADNMSDHMNSFFAHHHAGTLDAHPAARDYHHHRAAAAAAPYHRDSLTVTARYYHQQIHSPFAPPPPTSSHGKSDFLKRYIDKIKFPNNTHTPSVELESI